MAHASRMPLQHQAFSNGGQIPEPNVTFVFSRRACQEISRRAERHGLYVGAVSPENRQLFALLYVPQPDGLVIRTECQARPVRVERHGLDNAANFAEMLWV